MCVHILAQYQRCNVLNLQAQFDSGAEVDIASDLAAQHVCKTTIKSSVIVACINEKYTNYGGLVL